MAVPFTISSGSRFVVQFELPCKSAFVFALVSALFALCCHRKTEALEQQRKDLESHRAQLKLDHTAAEEESLRVKRAVDEDRKKIEDLLRERDILNKQVRSRNAKLVVFEQKFDNAISIVSKCVSHSEFDGGGC